MQPALQTVDEEPNVYKIETLGIACDMPDLTAKIYRVLDEDPCVSLGDYIANGGGEALRNARACDPTSIVEAVERSGLRGRGGAGFPTATKWRSILQHSSDLTPTPVVINGAEGEPSTFKDRCILRNNPYRVLEGALVACCVVGAQELVVCMKYSFSDEWDRVVGAIAEITVEGWVDQLNVRLVAGPSAYLFGEETALLEVVGGRQPFPRVSPPWRRGLDEDQPGSVLSATAELATLAGSVGAPALVNNVETFANIALIVRHGPEWFREIGTDGSPGSIVCTVVGDVLRHGVGEFAMGTPLRKVVEELGIGPLEGRHIVGVLPGISSALLTEDLLDTPLSHENFKTVGSALGSCGFRVIDDAADPFALAYGAARFLAIESCGQCSPCKVDGLAITAKLKQLLDGTADEAVEAQLHSRLATVTDQARCSLAMQTQIVVGSLVAFCINAPMAAVASRSSNTSASSNELSLIPDRATDRVTNFAMLPLVDIVDGSAVYDEQHLLKQPDWSYDPVDSASFPAQHLQGVRLNIDPPRVHV